ncbi:MAG: serine hydrolase [Patescibacteria group bacterium]
MFSWLLALTLYLTVGQAHPALALADLGLSGRSFLPISKTVDQPVINPQAPVKIDPTRLGIETEARAAVVLDWETNKAMFRKNADEPLPIASLTKLATALVVLESGVSLDQEVEIKSSDARPGGIPYEVPGEKILVRDLLHASLIASSNGSTVALARSTGLTLDEFAIKMNDLAKRLGMEATNFVEPTGIDVNNVASARDVAKLIQYSLSNDLIHSIVLKDKYEFSAVTGMFHSFNSTDALLGGSITRPPYIFLGGKTGFLPEAGYCFGAAVSNGDGNRIIAVVLGAPSKQSRFDEVSALMYWSFDAFTWPE